MRIMKTPQLQDFRPLLRLPGKEVIRLAITKITNIGENRGAGSRAAHLKNALKYIMNPKNQENVFMSYRNFSEAGS